MTDTFKLSSSGEEPSATQGVDSPVVESETTLPLYMPPTAEKPGGTLIAWITETEARKLIKDHTATPVADRHGKNRRVILTAKPKDLKLDPGSSSVITDASRTIRRESLTAPLWCFGHIRSDLAQKRQVSREELTADGVLPGVKRRRPVRPMGR